jgi:predicted RecB family nuclease
MDSSPKKKRFLSKSQFFRGTRCSKAWKLFWSHSELKTSRLDNHDVFQIASKEILLKSRILFPEGEEITGNTEQKISKTLQAVQNKTPIIYNAHFQRDKVLVSVDILKHEQGSWKLILVKSASKKKRRHIREVALQLNILKSNGLSISSASLLHVNTSYILEGKLDLNDFFTEIDITELALNLQSKLDGKFISLNDTLNNQIPEAEIGTYCLQPHECEFKNHCWSAIPETSIFDLTRLATAKKVELYLKGITESQELPEDYPLSEYQKIQIHSEKTNTRFINEKAIEKFLNKLTFPLYFLDFEALQPVVPLFQGDNPFEFLPVQFSLHYLETKEGELQHKEFIAENNHDPRLGFAKALVNSIPENACILVYNVALEKKINKSLASRFPEMEKQLKTINSQLVDLIEPFNNKYIYDPKMKGKSSIKAVFPVLVPEMEKAYKNLNIKNGMMAMGAFFNLLENRDNEEKDKIRQDLLDYCRLDTLAMVKVWQYLNNLFPALTSQKTK